MYTLHDESYMLNNRFKYPRTPHLPWSCGPSDDDKILPHTQHFEGREVVVTEKMDGENTTLYADYIHARSLNSRPHPSREWVKRLHAQIAFSIPNGWRLCGENLYARHSIAYENLASYFYLFSIWDDKNYCLSWQETLEWVELLQLSTPPVIYRGLWDEKLISRLPINVNKCEGYVVRCIQAFSYEAFGENVAKWVRQGHVSTDKHWMHRVVIPNRLHSTH